VFFAICGVLHIGGVPKRPYMIINLLMLTIFQATFVMFSLCYAQRLNYLQCTVFPSLGILQHYTEFDVYIIVMLESY